MPVRFDPHLVYPSDNVGGCYIDMPGRVVHVGSPLRDREEYPITVEVAEDEEHTGFTGYMGAYVPRIGDDAVIRIYDRGGGWHPDNRVSQLVRPPRSAEWRPKTIHARWSGIRLCECSRSMTLLVSELLAVPLPTCPRCVAALSRGRFMRHYSNTPWLWQVPGKEEADGG